MTRIESGCLLIADITGYTAYLSQSELAHAQDILSSLLELLVANTKPPLHLSRLAGDAVISYALRTGFTLNQTFLEMLEQTYIAFRRAIDLMVMNNACQCNACANVSNLDLKFFVHYGEFGIQRLSAHDELVGSDVNLIHRLLKNHVTEQTGFRAYALFTDAAIRSMGLDDACEIMTPLVESYEHLGEVKIWVQDMQPVWKAGKEKARIPFPEDRLLVRVSTEIPLPPEVVWDYLASPEYRNVLTVADRQEVSERQNGRIGEGSAYHCYHGDRMSVNLILEWRPFERILTRDLPGMPMPVGQPVMLSEYRLEAIAGGTRMTQSHSKGEGPWLARTMLNSFLKGQVKAFQRDLDNFGATIVGDHGERMAAAGEAAVQEAEIAG